VDVCCQTLAKIGLLVIDAKNREREKHAVAMKVI
jgi:hypothetical protein